MAGSPNLSRGAAYVGGAYVPSTTTGGVTMPIPTIL